MRKTILLLILTIFASVLSADNMIWMKIGEFSTDYGAPDYSNLNLKREMPKSGHEYYLVQFIAGTRQDWKDNINSTGAKVLEYIPDNAFIVRMTAEQFNAVSKMDFVKFIQIYQPAYRIEPSLVFSEHKAMDNEKSGEVRLLVKAFNDEDLDLFHNDLKNIPDVTFIEGEEYVRLSVPETGVRNAATAIANLPEVYWVEREYPAELHNAWSRWIMDSFDTLSMKNGSDSWYGQFTLSSAADSARMTLYAHGLYGQGQIVGDDDTGLDWDNVYFRDPTQSVWYDKDKDQDCESPNYNHRKIVAYNVHADTFDLNSSGHGTHTNGSVAADSLGSNLPNTTTLSRGMGMAPLAKLAFTDIGGSSDGLVLPTDYRDIYLWAYDAGARITTSSWGQSAGGYSSYTLNSQQLDYAAWDYKDLCMLRSAGNSNTSRDSVNTPATAKNIITVGATESGFGTGTAWNTYGVATRNELLDVAEFSSHGPTVELQLKPEVCGTGGWYIWSIDSDGSLTTNNSGLTYMGGTSMSTPTTAGFTALTRQYLTEGWYPSGVKNAADAMNPSGALLKAMIVSATRNSPGAYSTSTINSSGTQNVPSYGQGWGRVTMADVIYFAGDTRDLWIQDITPGFSSSGQYDEYTITTDASASEYLKIVLVWTDYPAAVSPSNALVNDLNLEVVAGGNTYLGNVFGTNARSITGGTADNRNVTEVVWLDAIPNSSITVRVRANAINNGPQDYALVVTGDLVNIPPSGMPYKKSAVQDTLTSGTVVNDGKLNNGETADLDIWIKNNTGANQNSVTGTLSSTSPYVTMVDGSAAYGSVQDADSAKGLFRVSISSTTPDGTSLPFRLIVNYGVNADTSEFSLTSSGVSYAMTNKDIVVFDYSAKSRDMYKTVNDPSIIIKKTDIITPSLVKFSGSSEQCKGAVDTLKYDDAETEGVATWSGVNYWAVKFNAAMPCSVRTVFWGRYMDNNNYALPYDTIMIWNDNAGIPGAILSSDAVLTTDDAAPIIYYINPSTEAEVSGDFWVGGYVYTGEKTGGGGRYQYSYFLSDTIGTGTYSYYSADRTTWNNFGTAGYLNDLVIRAEVEYSITASDSATLFVLNNDPGSMRDFNVTSVQVKNAASWIVMIDPESGLVPLGDSLGINIMIDTAGLAAGTYEDTLLISADADLSKAVTMQVPVRLVLTGPLVSKNISLTAMEKNGAVLLNWFSPYSSEVLIARGTGTEESVIDRIFADEGANTYTDYEPEEGSSYYKIGVVNAGSVQWSGRVKIVTNSFENMLFAQPGRTGTLISYSLADDADASITVYDLAGREVRTILESSISKGAYTAYWDHKDNAQNELRSGVYFIRLKTGGIYKTIKSYILE